MVKICKQRCFALETETENESIICMYYFSTLEGKAIEFMAALRKVTQMLQSDRSLAVGWQHLFPSAPVRNKGKPEDGL